MRKLRPRVQLTLEPRAGGSPVACDEHVLGTGQSLKGHWEGSFSDRRRRIKRRWVLSTGSAVSRLCGWIVSWGQGSQEPCPLWKGRVIPLPWKETESSAALSTLLLLSRGHPGSSSTVQGGKTLGRFPPGAAGVSDEVGGGCAWGLGHLRRNRNCVRTEPFALSLDIVEGRISGPLSEP